MPSPIDDLTTHLVLLSGGTGLRDDRIGELLGQWASSSPWAHHQFLVAAKVIRPSVHKETCKAAVAQYAWCVLTPGALVELVLNMWSPKNAFWAGLRADPLAAAPVSVEGCTVEPGLLRSAPVYPQRLRSLSGRSCLPPCSQIRRHPPPIPALQRWCGPCTPGSGTCSAGLRSSGRLTGVSPSFPLSEGICTLWRAVRGPRSPSPW